MKQPSVGLSVFGGAAVWYRFPFGLLNTIFGVGELEQTEINDEY